MTNKESECIGLFIKELFILLNKMGVKEDWEKTFMNNPSLSLTVGKPNPAPFDRFEKIIHAMHKRLTMSLSLNLKSDSYLRIKNCVTIMSGIQEVYPKDLDMCEDLEKTIRGLTEKGQTEELKSDVRAKLESYL